MIFVSLLLGKKKRETRQFPCPSIANDAEPDDEADHPGKGEDRHHDGDDEGTRQS